MISFKILKKSKKSKARLGILKTLHGEIETPAFVPVATQAVLKTLTAEELSLTKSQVLISNTFHLHLKPGEDIVKHHGGIHKFSNLNIPIMTDSGGFQVFSLGFGQDLGVGKVLKFFPGDNTHREVKKSAQPKTVKITPDGVRFRSPINGNEIFIGPKESIGIQQKIGADIMFAFDECTPPLATREYIEDSLKRTHAWAKMSLNARTSEQALFGIVQGSHYKDLRYESATFINSLGFDGYGIGGDLGTTKRDMQNILRWTMPYLDEQKPRHLLGVGYPEDMERIIKEGVDTFDCTVPTHYARRGVAFTSKGKINLTQGKFLKDKKVLDVKCKCQTCANYTRGYICHLFKAHEVTGMRLLTVHNLYYFNTLAEEIRNKIKKGLL